VTADQHAPQPTDHTGLRVLDVDECLRLLASVPVGRFAFVLDGEISVLPVVHVVDGVDVCFRTAGASKLGAAVDHERVAFEADAYHAERWTGWSVLVQGTAEPVWDETDRNRLDATAPPTWISAHTGGFRWIRVRPQSITGRALG
jgi:uncharacterized protein